MVFLYCFALKRDEEMVRLYGVSARALPVAPKRIYIGKPHHPACRTRQAFLLQGTSDGAIALAPACGEEAALSCQSLLGKRHHSAGVAFSVNASAPLSSLTPSAPSARLAASPTGIRRMAFLPSLMSNSSPGSKSSIAV